jgi:uncharacterized protein
MSEESSNHIVNRTEATNAKNIALVIIARYPEAGKTKTRLARTLGNQQTADLYQAFLTDLARRFAGSEYHLHWTYTPPTVDYQAFVSSLVPEHTSSMHCFPQEGNELSERLLYAFHWCKQQGFQRTILIGSDTPHISRDIIEAATKALDEADVVLGPSDDGGYYLIGMDIPYDVFSGIPMSTSEVRERTIEAAHHLGLKVHLLETLLDVDEYSDLQRLAALLEKDSKLAPITADHLTHMRLNA